MAKFFLFIFFLYGTSMTVLADSIEVQASMSKLFAQGFTNGRSEKYGFQLPGSSEVTMEFYLLYAKERKIDTRLYYEWLDGNILYRVIFLSREYANTCVFALVFDEDVTVEEYSKEGGYIWKIEHDDPLFKQFVGKTYYFVSRNMFFKVNENDDPPTAFINIDMDGDGIIQDGEGRCMWF